MNQSEETILTNIPVKPFGLMHITSQKSVLRHKWPFSRDIELFIRNILAVRYLSGIPIIGVPGLEFQYKNSLGDIETLRINFPGFVTMLSFQKHTGYDAKGVFDMICELSQQPNQ
ncbi:MAG: hypothetical protein GY803_26925 [Chloroflexi bacterium]|nr:hypothetical protein [Chloroflexota bacterium]